MRTLFSTAILISLLAIIICCLYQCEFHMERTNGNNNSMNLYYNKPHKATYDNSSAIETLKFACSVAHVDLLPNMVREGKDGVIVHAANISYDQKSMMVNLIKNKLPNAIVNWKEKGTPYEYIQVK